MKRGSIYTGHDKPRYKLLTTKGLQLFYEQFYEQFHSNLLFDIRLSQIS